MIRIFKTLLITILSYLLQATAMPLLGFHSVSPNINIAMLSILIVAYGRQHGLVSSIIIGILMEIMIQNLAYFHLLIYPVISILSMLAFADKTERRMEMERAMRRYYGNMNPLLRTLLCTLYMALLYELIHIGYGMLTGIELSANTYLRLLIFVGYTTLLSLLLMIPLRAFLGLPSGLPKFSKSKRREPKELDPTLGRQPLFQRKPNALEEEPQAENTDLQNKTVRSKDPLELPDIDNMFQVENYQRYVPLSNSEKETLSKLDMHVDDAPQIKNVEEAQALEQEVIVDEESGMETIIIPVVSKPEPEIDLSRFQRPKQDNLKKTTSS